VFERQWFLYYDELPAGLTDYAQSLDMAFKDTNGSDYVVGLVATRRAADIYLVDRVKGKWAFSDSCKQVTRLSRRYPQARTILIEDAANGPAIIDALRRTIGGIIPVTPEGGKMARAQAAQPRVEAGNVYLPNPAPSGRRRPDRDWVLDFVQQLIVFPHGAHDDDVDAFTQLVVRWQQRKRPSPGVW
jgi:predicted phage terminase large subunit-like protein